MRLTTAAARVYISTSQVALVCGVLSWDEYLLRLRFVRDSVDSGTFEHTVTTEILRQGELDGEDEWPIGEPDDSGPGGGLAESEVSMSSGATPLEPPPLAFVAAGSTGLHQWLFRQSDPDFFPSIPHGHWRSERKKKLDAYRGWIYREDKQTGRESRWKIIALWNEEKFRSFATAAIQWYLTAFPGYVWRVPYPLRLARRRRRSA